MDVVCQYYDITPFELFKDTRRRNYVYRRFFYMSLCRKHTKASTFKIGEIAEDYGREKPYDHATVLHGVRTMDDLMRYDKYLRSQYGDMNEMILDKMLKNNITTIVPRNVNLLSLCG